MQRNILNRIPFAMLRRGHSRESCPASGTLSDHKDTHYFGSQTSSALCLLGVRARIKLSGLSSGVANVASFVRDVELIVLLLTLHR